MLYAVITNVFYFFNLLRISYYTHGVLIACFVGLFHMNLSIYIKGGIGHVVDQKRIATPSEESKTIVAIIAVPALAASATPLLTVPTVPPGRAASIWVSTRVICPAVACISKAIPFLRWVRCRKWRRNRCGTWRRRTTDIPGVSMSSIEAGLLAKLLLGPEIVDRTLLGAAVWNKTPAIAVFIVCYHIGRPLVVTFDATPVIGLYSRWRWPACWHRRRVCSGERRGCLRRDC